MATLQTLTYRFTLDAFKNGVQRIIHGYEIGETAARKMEISLMYGINTYELPLGNITASMYVKRPSDTDPSINACTIDAENNKIIYEMQDSDIAEAGIVNMQLKVFDNDKILISPQFGIDVWESLIDDSSASESPSYTALTTALAQAKAYNDKAITDVVVEEDLTFVVSFADGTEYTSDALKDAAATFEDYSLESEGYALGTQDGVPVEAGSPYYHNNSAYYSGMASGYANMAENAKGYAYGYANDALGYKNDASGYADNASNSAMQAGLDALVAHNRASDSDASATTSESWARGGTGTRTGEDTNNSKYFSELAQATIAELLTHFGVSVVGTQLVFGLEFAELYDVSVVGTQLVISNRA